MNANAAEPTLKTSSEPKTSFAFDAESKRGIVKFHDQPQIFVLEDYLTKEEYDRLAPELITLSPDDHVERYKVDFPFPQLDKYNRQKLKLEIEQARRIISPIITTPSAAGGYICLDGWARFEISKELGLPCPAVVLHGLSPEQALEIFLSSNLSRRQMGYREKKNLGFIFRDAGMSNAQIARLLGVTPGAVSKWFSPKKELSPAEIIAREIDKAIREIQGLLDAAQRGQSSKQHKQTQTALPGLVNKLAKLQETFEELVKYAEENSTEAEALDASEAGQQPRVPLIRRRATRSAFEKKTKGSSRIIKRIKRIRKAKKIKERMVKFHHVSPKPNGDKKAFVRLRDPP